MSGHRGSGKREGSSAGLSQSGKEVSCYPSSPAAIQQARPGAAKVSCSKPEGPQGLGKSEAEFQAQFANTVARQTRIELSQEKPITQEMDIYFGC